VVFNSNSIVHIKLPLIKEYIDIEDVLLVRSMNTLEVFTMNYISSY